MKKIIIPKFLILSFLLIFTPPASAETIYACKVVGDPNFPGILYHVGNTIPTCQPGHEVISWNQTGPGVKQFVFKGITTTTATGDEGIGRFSQLCADEVSPESRFCTSKEVLQSVNPFPSPLVQEIWVNPSIVGGTSTFMDYSGKYLLHSCFGWDEQGDNGLALRGQGRTVMLPCANSYAVACCGPAQ